MNDSSMMFISVNGARQLHVVVPLSALAKVKYPYFLSVAGLVLVGLAGLYRLIQAFSFRRVFFIRPRAFFPANAARTPLHMFVGYRAFPATLLPSFVTIVGFVMIFLGLVWVGVLIFRESAQSKEP
jgi:hypothetical protein